MSEKDNQTARVFSTLTDAVKSLFKHYEIDNENMEITLTVESDPFDVRYRICVYPKSGLVSFFSVLPFAVEEEHREFYAFKLCGMVYDELNLGTFDFNTETGKTVFRISMLYRDSLISEETFRSVIRCVFDTVTDFAKRMIAWSKGKDVD